MCLALLAGFLGMLAAVFALMKKSDVYSGAMARARANGEVVAALGKPIKDTFFFTGNINESGSSGDANFTIPVSGPKGKANLYVTATRSSGAWHIDHLIVQIEETKQRIDISESNQSPATTSGTNIHSGQK
jgi:hypothetical protein